MTDTATKEAMSTEQAADLAALKASVAGAQPVTLTDTEPDPARPDLATEIAGLVMVAVATLGPMFPSLKDTYTKEVTEAAAQAIAAVCKKHGWMQNGMLGEWGEELACVAIVGPLAYSTYTGIRADLAQRKPAKTEALGDAGLGDAGIPT